MLTSASTTTLHTGQIDLVYSTNTSSKPRYALTIDTTSRYLRPWQHTLVEDKLLRRQTVITLTALRA
jgi:hypothetical protein